MRGAQHDLAVWLNGQRGRDIVDAVSAFSRKIEGRVVKGRVNSACCSKAQYLSINVPLADGTLLYCVGDNVASVGLKRSSSRSTVRNGDDDWGRSDLGLQVAAAAELDYAVRPFHEDIAGGIERQGRGDAGGADFL